MADEKVAEEEERLVEAEITRNTSRRGQLLLVGTRHMLPLSVAKAMRAGGTARPVPKVQLAVPPPPPPKPAVFDGEDESEEESVSEEDE